VDFKITGGRIGRAMGSKVEIQHTTSLFEAQNEIFATCRSLAGFSWWS